MKNEIKIISFGTMVQVLLFVAIVFFGGLFIGVGYRTSSYVYGGPVMALLMFGLVLLFFVPIFIKSTFNVREQMIHYYSFSLRRRSNKIIPFGEIQNICIKFGQGFPFSLFHSLILSVKDGEDIRLKTSLCFRFGNNIVYAPLRNLSKQLSSLLNVECVETLHE